ncbi:MAG TPA: hypothetical protein VM266_14480 [Solirubrobacteraceae bacterium]|nr:hypothetical protein [Solirubrobacteraceae bacterium]
MLDQLALLAAETAGHASEGKRMIFYVAGTIAAIWGFLIGIYGTMRGGNFPGPRAAKPIMAVSALVVVGAMAGSVLSG